MFGSKEKKEEKAAAKEQELLEKYGLTDLQDPVDKESVKMIAHNVFANNLMLVGAGLKGRTDVVATISLLQTLIEQNWIIIRQLDKINSK